MKAVIQLVNHKDVNTIVTRLEVTRFWYHRWREMARSLSNTITVTVRKDAAQGKKKIIV